MTAWLTWAGIVLATTTSVTLLIGAVLNGRDLWEEEHNISQEEGEQ